MKTLRATLPLLLLVVATGSLAAQTGGSSYSIFNIGDLRDSRTAAALGRGGVEAPIRYGTILNGTNPATWGALNFVTIHAGLSFTQYSLSNAEESVFQNSTRVENFSFGIPISDSLGITLGFGYHPYSVVEYAASDLREVSVVDTSYSAVLTYSGSGGVSRATVGASVEPVEWLGIGATADVYFGSVDRRTFVDFVPATLNDAGYVSEARHSGLGFTGGLLARPIDDFWIAGTFTPAVSLDRDVIETGIFRERGLDDTVNVDSAGGTLEVPAKITAGVAYRTGRFLLSTQTTLQAWSGSTTFSRTRDKMRVAAGVDRLPSNSVNAAGTDRWTFRFGAYYDQTYYNVEETGIDDIGLTLGAFIPLTSYGGLNSSTGLDVGLALGKRGTTDGGLTSETYGRVMVELSVSELWFQNSRR